MERSRNPKPKPPYTAAGRRRDRSRNRGMSPLDLHAQRSCGIRLKDVATASRSHGCGRRAVYPFEAGPCQQKTTSRRGGRRAGCEWDEDMALF